VIFLFIARFEDYRLKEFYATFKQQLFSVLRNIVSKRSVCFETGICCFVSCLNEIG
jgi:uncharacterized protein YbgA (DUF1722 family)